VIREHYNAVRALLPGTVNVYMWSVPGTPAYPYVVLWGSPGDESSGGTNDGESLDATRMDVFETRIRATYAGVNGDSMLIVCRNVRAALNRKTPTVAGWKPGKLRQASLMDAQPDTSITFSNGTHPVYAVDEFSLTSHKL
jgi:hypothetical protein